MIRFIFRWIFRAIVLAVVLAIGFVLVKDTILRHYVEARIRQETGFDARIGRLEVNLFAPRINAQNIVLYSPAEFAGTAMLDIPDLHIEYSRRKLAGQKVHLKLLRLNVRELHLVESKEGRTNLVEFLNGVAPEFLRGEDKGGGNGGFSGVDMINLSVGKVRYTNLRHPKRSREVTLGIRNDIIQNVDSEQDITAIIFKILLRAGITIYADGGGRDLPVKPVAIRKVGK